MRNPPRLSAVFSLSLAAALLAATGCGPTLSGGDVAAPEPPGGYSTLGNGDVFELSVYGEPDLSGMHRVSAEGVIVVPYLGEVRVEGLTPGEVAERIKEGLKGSYLVDPQVSIFVKEYNSKRIYVFGSVKKPGTLRYEDHMSIVQAITSAGGFTAIAAENDVTVTRVVDGVESRISIRVKDIVNGKAKNFELRPGDIVFVRESPL